MSHVILRNLWPLSLIKLIEIAKGLFIFYKKLGKRDSQL